jgi:1,4-dihydroxy-2-naphthoate polyprenyltransferase
MKGAVAWFHAARPKTLVAGLTPVAVGSALAFRTGAFRLWPALATLAGTLLIQVGTNLVNDSEDARRGADTDARLGPARATQQGWLTGRQVMRGAAFCFAAAFALGCYLVSVSSIWLLPVGVTSIAAGYAYTAGPFPLGYNGLGDVFVMVFFGIVAVCGTFFVQTSTVSGLSLWCSIPVGALGVALLAVNNVRDRPTDMQVGKRTLVVRFGTRFGQVEWLAMIALSLLIPVALAVSGLTTSWVLASLAAAPLAVAPGRLVFTQAGQTLNRALAQTARFQLVFCLLFALGLTQ